jgi:hypothetical protein
MDPPVIPPFCPGEVLCFVAYFFSRFSSYLLLLLFFLPFSH